MAGDVARAIDLLRERMQARRRVAAVRLARHERAKPSEGWAHYHKTAAAAVLAAIDGELKLLDEIEHGLKPPRAAERRRPKEEGAECRTEA
jgi:hypothetical protein